MRSLRSMDAEAVYVGWMLGLPALSPALLITFSSFIVTGSSQDRSLKLLNILTVCKAPGQEAWRLSDLWVPVWELQAFNQGSFCRNLASHLSPKSCVSA